MTCDSGFRIPDSGFLVLGFPQIKPSMAWGREREGEGEREIGESETNIFKPNQTIHLGSQVTLSSFGNLYIHFRSISQSILDVGELTYQRWRSDIRRWRTDFIRWRTGRWRTDTLAKRPVTDINASFEIIFYLTFHMLLHTSSEVMVDTKNCSLNIQDH